MDKINELPDELMVKILTFVPTKVAVSTSILSKRWESIWKSVPKLECHCDVFKPEILDFLNKNLPLRARFIESLCLKFCEKSRQEKIEMWVKVGASSCLREVRVNHISFYGKLYVFFPSSLYTCKTLVTLKLEDSSILVDAPQDVCLPCLKILHLQCVTYSNQDSLPLLLSYCPVLEDLLIARGFKMDNVKAVVVTVPTLLRLSLKSTSALTHDKYVIVTPSLKYFKFKDNETDNLSELVETMSELVEADISVCKNIEMFLKSVTSVKRLTLRQLYNSIDKYPFGIEFN